MGERVQSFEGTPIECEAWLRQRFFFMRCYVEASEKEEHVDVYDRSVWRVELTGTDRVAVDEVRTDMLQECERIKSERELFDAVIPKR